MSSFGALTEYQLGTPSRWSNGIAVAPDGSVWFGEQSVPGVGHLYANGTLMEYPWPSASKGASTCGFRTGIWGIALWNGMVWGTDFDESALVGLNPSTGATEVINVSKTAPFPYTVATSPDGSLWFVSLADAPVLGRVSQNLSVTVIGVALPKGETPAQVQFASPTQAYLIAIDPATNSGGVYTFDPQNVAGTIEPVQVGGGFNLFSPNSVSVSDGKIWVTQHYPSIVASYDMASALWTLYPTSVENYTTTTLPYFIVANGSKVWFNEHYGNKIAMINTLSQTMTEFSEANPPVTNGSNVENDLTIALAHSGVWFTSTTGNYVGFVNAAFRPGFAISAVGGNDSATVLRGNGARFALTVSGNWTSALRVQVSDSEGATGVPRLISISPGDSLIAPATGAVRFQVALQTDSALEQGRYTVAVTVTDGLVYQTVYLFLTVQ
jgi:streptogramin lyase